MHWSWFGWFGDRQTRACRTATEEGVVEVWLTSEDTGAYGRDIGSSMPELMRTLLEGLPEGCMLRVGMTNPPYMREHLPAIAALLNHPRCYSFLHIPVQSGSDNVLSAMRREYTCAEFCEVADVRAPAMASLGHGDSLPRACTRCPLSSALSCWADVYCSRLCSSLRRFSPLCRT